MEGIIASAPAVERTRSNSNPDQAIFNGARRPSVPPSVLARSGSMAFRRPSVDPFGHYDGFGHPHQNRTGSVATVGSPFSSLSRPPGSAGTGSSSPVRPGLGSRQSSATNFPLNGNDRRSSSITPQPQLQSTFPSLQARQGSVFPISNGPGGGPGIGPGAWTAPDSWAVKAESGASLDHDSSDDDDDDEDEEGLGDDGMDETESDQGLSPALGKGSGGSISGINGGGGTLEKLETRLGSIAQGSGAEKIFGHGFEADGTGAAGLGLRPGTARPGTRGGRPVTADGEGGGVGGGGGRRQQAQKNVSLYIVPLRFPSSRSLTLDDLSIVHDSDIPTRRNFLNASCHSLCDCK